MIPTLSTNTVNDLVKSTLMSKLVESGLVETVDLPLAEVVVY
jgi:hypothetical protein